MFIYRHFFSLAGLVYLAHGCAHNSLSLSAHQINVTVSLGALELVSFQLKPQTQLLGQPIFLVISTQYRYCWWLWFNLTSSLVPYLPLDDFVVVLSHFPSPPFATSPFTFCLSLSFFPSSLFILRMSEAHRTWSIEQFLHSAGRETEAQRGETIMYRDTLCLGQSQEKTLKYGSQFRDYLPKPDVVWKVVLLLVEQF